MPLRTKIAAVALLALLLVPGAAQAEDNRKDCRGPAITQQDNCRADEGERRKPKFQTKFFSE